MSKHDEPSPRLDEAIDRAVRRMMETDPPPGLRRRVLARLTTPGREAVVWWPRLGLAAATVAALVLAVVYLRPEPAQHVMPSPDTVAAQAPLPLGTPPQAADRHEPPAAEPPAPEARAPQPRTERLAAPPQMDDVFGPRPDGRVAAATVDTPGASRSEEALPEIAPLQVPALAGTLAMEAQDTAAPPQAKPAPPAASTNVRVEITLTEEGDGAAPAKTVAMLVMNQEIGRVRSGHSGIVLNVDARPTVLADGRIRVVLSLEYSPGALPPMSQSLTTVLENGTPLVVSTSADPKGTRRVTAEVTATILK